MSSELLLVGDLLPSFTPQGLHPRSGLVAVASQAENARWPQSTASPGWDEVGASPGGESEQRGKGSPKR